MRPSARAVISERKGNLGCTIFVILPYPLPSGADVERLPRKLTGSSMMSISMRFGADAGMAMSTP